MMADSFKPCAVNGCKNNAHWTAKGAKGWCASHYNRHRRHGDPLGGMSNRGATTKWLHENVGHVSETECLEWPFGRTSNGYGAATLGGKWIAAHRAMCILAHGEPPPEKPLALHTCGNGSSGCVNPNHLYWGTYAENAADSVAHGSNSFVGKSGTKHYNAALDADGVATARDLLAQGMSDRAVGDALGVHGGTIFNLRHGRTYADD